MFITAGGVQAGWTPGDPSIFEQLPNPEGWDVYSEWGRGPGADEGYGVADDWVCSTSEFVSDLHFWGSWKNDIVGETGNILLQIFEDGTGGKPGEKLWEHVVAETEYDIRLYTTGDQGWYDPRGEDDWDRHNHDNMYEYNINFIDNPFYQEAGNTYWLMVSMNYTGCEWGWKTSTDNGLNTAVFWDKFGHHGWEWQKLYEPKRWAEEEMGRPPEPMGMAFVLTPEPATLLLLGLGGLAILRRRKA